MHSQHYAQWINNYADTTVVFISGWGIDHRTFPTLRPDCNFLTLSPNQTLIENYISTHCSVFNQQRLILIGFSMGAYIAQTLVKQKTIAPDKTIIIGAKTSYEPSELNNIKRFLKRQKDAYMQAFYRSCFFSDTEWLNFKSLHNSQYSTLETLTDQLTLLETYRLTDTADLWIHGKQDAIAPYENITTTIDLLTIENCGHCPFFHEKWDDIFNTIYNL